MFRFFSSRKRGRRQNQSVWWTLPFFLWALQATVLNLRAFDVRAEYYTEALFFINTLQAANEGTVSLCLLSLVQLPGLLVHGRRGHHAAAHRAAIGVVSALAAVLLGYLLSTSITVAPLLDAFGKAAGAF